METDKLIGTMTMDGVTIRQVKFRVRPPPPHHEEFDGHEGARWDSKTCRDHRHQLERLQSRCVCVRRCIYQSFARCTVTKFDFYGGFVQNDHLSDYSMSGGVISFPNTAATGSGPAHRWVVPGTTVFWSAPGYFTIGSVQLQAVKQDATDTYVQTDATGGFPPIGSPISYRTGVMPRFTCDACSGDPALVATNIQSGATPLAPLATYSRRSYAPSGTSKNLGSLVVIGKLVSLTINVTQAYTGPDSAILNPTGEFHNFTVKQSDWSRYDWWPTINLKVAGERIITPSGVTCNGVSAGCSGDLNMNVPEAIWIPNGMGPSLPSKLSGGGTLPKFTITAKTDQEVLQEVLP
jgi:hypothetical protein